MYYCTTCGAVFDEPGVEYQMHAFGDSYASEPRSCCPKCGGDYEEIVGECQNCEKVISTEAEGYYKKDDMLFCCTECVMEHYGIEEVCLWLNRKE